MPPFAVTAFREKQLSGFGKALLFFIIATILGILPNAGMAFINQRHPLGRVSFINVVTDAMRTVTGFDLNSRIVD